MRSFLRALLRVLIVGLLGVGAIFGPDILFAAGVWAHMVWAGPHRAAVAFIVVPLVLWAVLWASWALLRSREQNRYVCAVSAGWNMYAGICFAFGDDDPHLRACAVLWFAWSLWFFHCFVRDRFDYDNYTKVYE